MKKFIFWPRSLAHHTPATPESFTQIGSAICEIIRNHRLKSAVLATESLARFARSALISGIRNLGCHTELLDGS